MNEYIIFTDSACDIKPEQLKEWEVSYINLSFHFEDEDREYSNDEMDISEFYNRMRSGSIAKTSAINPDTYINTFEEILNEGKDILCLAFSSGLSTTCNSARIAADELKEKYPERKIIIVDSLSASAGQGLLLYLMVQKKNSGCTIEEVADYAENIKLNICHWFSVDDLVYLKRGGRVSPTVAFVGTVLGIKPVLHVDNEGRLISVTKARGRKAALNTLIDKCGELGEDIKNGTIFISHADCKDDADNIAEQIATKFGGSVDIITADGAVIGAHSGPGTIALFFVGKER